ncbi:MAG: discoidin domain-containing protein, partial [Nitrososphaeraceae archaeon]
MLFVPISISPSPTVGASLKSWNDEGYEIPIAISTTNNVNPVIDEESVEQLAISELQTRVQRPTDQVSALATCDKLPMSTVTASGNDGNVPSNVLDNNLNTRWSNLGVGSWIQLDLGAKKSICSVDITWYRGDVRQNNFVISISDDGTTFSNKFSGTSSLGSSPQKYTLPTGIEGRYVRVTVNGNTENEWASITEISVLGGASGGSGGGGSNLIGTLFHKWQTGADSGTWSTYSFLNGEIRSNSDLALAMNNDGRLQVFMIGTDNALYYKTQTAAGSST